ncbi:MAG: signal peptide peptidase SppA [Chitinivibrionales bacterium]|nr:signal peptide peptidase SppA [Chitinivibrionales bacterium]MBD3395206.1 signal peptide peptidase SppA [Chitinivibrionales bacterium]
MGYRPHAPCVGGANHQGQPDHQRHGPHARRFNRDCNVGGIVTRRQKITVAALLAAPVVIGLLLLSFNESPSSSIVPVQQANRIGLVRIVDVIYYADNYVWQLKELRKDKSIAGVIIRVESPGGGVAPSQELYNEVMRYRKEDKPLVVSMGNLAASGAYYLSSPAIKIFANPGTLTGSIGVIFRFPQYHKLFDKIGLDMETIKAGRYKDIGTPHRSMSRDERRLLQELLDDTHEQFIGDVSRARSMEADSLRSIADGRIFTGRRAKEIGLVDSLGGYEVALAWLREHVGLTEKAKTIEKKKRHSLLRDVLTEGIWDRIPFLGRPHQPGGMYFLMEHY